MKHLLLIPLLWAAPSPLAAKEDTHAKALGAFSRGDALSWDQLEVVASDAGLSKEKIEQLKLKDHVEKVGHRLHVAVEVGGFMNGMGPDEEFRLYKGQKTGVGAMVFNAAFWSKGKAIYDNDAFIAYLVLRAQAYYAYLTLYDAERCAWVIEEESPSLQTLKLAVNDSLARWVVDNGIQTARDKEFRASMAPHQNDSATLKALIQFAHRTIAQKAADDWAIEQYRQTIGPVPIQISDWVRHRERILAADFNRAHGAMTRTERAAFFQPLHSPFRYRRKAGVVSSDPTYDPQVPAEAEAKP